MCKGTLHNMNVLQHNLICHTNMCDTICFCTVKFQSIILIIASYFLFVMQLSKHDCCRRDYVDQDLILTTIQLRERKMPIQMEVEIRPKYTSGRSTPHPRSMISLMA